MKAFTDLYTLLDETTKTTAKVRALKDYFAEAPAQDAAWAVYFLIGRKPRQVVPSGKLRAWAAVEAGVPDWLFQESYDAVGDVAETIALLLPPPEQSSDSTFELLDRTAASSVARSKRGKSAMLPCSRPGASSTSTSGSSGTNSSAAASAWEFRSSL